MSVRFSRSTGALAIASSVAPKQSFQLEEVRVHLSGVGGAGDLTLSVNSGAGAVYDAVLVTQDMTALADYFYLPSKPLQFQKGDEIDVVWANAGTKTYGVEIVWRGTGPS